MLLLDREQRILLSTAEDQSRDDVNDSHGPVIPEVACPVIRPALRFSAANRRVGPH